MTSKLGVYWSVMHRREQDYAYFRAMQPTVFKIMDGGTPDYEFARSELPTSLVIARDWALSEQHDDMLSDPAATGARHAREWNEHQQRLRFDKANTLILGINEPKIWDAGVAEALRRYTIALCNEANRFGLRTGAMQLSVGWPNNQGGESLPDWSPWHGVEAAILASNSALIVHEYWADRGPGENWGWWGGRVLKCPWQVPVVIGECGVDMYVKDGSVGKQQRGWRSHMPAERYASELAEYVQRMSIDPRFLGCCVFASDFASHDWYSFDIEPAYSAIKNLPAPPVIEPPPIGPIEPHPLPPTSGLVHPLPGSTITQNFYQNPADYARFDLPGHNGLDLGGMAQRTPVLAIAQGVVAYSDFDPNYGNYVRIDHPSLDCYSFYAHLDEPGLAAGTAVNPGDTIGLLGSSGNSTGPHLHLEIRLRNPDGSYQDGTPMRKGRVDPRTWAILHGLTL